MGTINICVVFQARRLGEITKEVKINREEVQGWSFGLLGGTMRIQPMKPEKVSGELGRKLREVVTWNS